MCPAHKTHNKSRQKHKRTQIWLTISAVLLAIIIISTVSIIKWPASNTGNQQSTTTADPAFTAFTNHYLDLMKNLNSTQAKTQMAAQLNPVYNQTDLFAWQKTKMTFGQDPTGWYENPIQILSSKDGICVQWSIVYVSACLSLGYQSRLVVAVDTQSWSFIHVWAEDYYNGKWVHVDPSDAVWNNPSRYQSWGWGSFGSQVKVYAFEGDSFQEVTNTYAMQSG
jgi:transglutaminase-like putative cysteine protease